MDFHPGFFIWCLKQKKFKSQPTASLFIKLGGSLNLNFPNVACSGISVCFSMYEFSKLTTTLVDKVVAQ